jgi:hypothetical protein
LAGGPVWKKFSPFGRIFSLGCFMKNTNLSQIFVPLFYTVKVIIIFTKNGLGCILGDFFTNSSGHPAFWSLVRSSSCHTDVNPHFRPNFDVYNCFILLAFPALAEETAEL